MKIIIHGALGRMGKAVLECVEAGHSGGELAALVDGFSQTPEVFTTLDGFSGDADCIIDFSNHVATVPLVDYAVAHQLPVVIATTGQTPEETAYITEAGKKIPVFLSGNMSVGIALLAELSKKTAQVFPDADIEIIEVHHNQKLDAPSGTALMLANSVKEARENATFLVGRHEYGKRTKAEIGIHAIRMGNVIGEHQVMVNTGSQTITLKHEAHSRSLFAEGAMVAAQFLTKQTPGIYTMYDMVK